MHVRMHALTLCIVRSHVALAAMAAAVLWVALLLKCQGWNGCVAGVVHVRVCVSGNAVGSPAGAAVSGAVRSVCGVVQEVLAGGVHSAKLAALLERLREAAAESEDLARPIKSVVFSQFTGMLTAVGAALDSEGVTHVRIDGAMTAAKRAAAIAAFSDTAPDSARVALVSLKAGGVGLNLTVASQVRRRRPRHTVLSPRRVTAPKPCAGSSMHAASNSGPVPWWVWLKGDRGAMRAWVRADSPAGPVVEPGDRGPGDG